MCRNKIFFIALSIWFSACSSNIALQPIEANTREPSPGETWTIAELLQSGHPAIKIQGDPFVSEDMSQEVYFDGDDDRILVAGNPLASASEFTIEMVFFPLAAFPDNAAPRVVHIENVDDPDLRVTLELRLTENAQWYFDAFIKSPLGGVTLIEPTLTHPTGRWYHAAISYRDGVFKTFIDGKPELSGEAHFQDLGTNTLTSIGARLNHIHWFKGAIHSVHFAKTAYNPAEFVLLGKPPVTESP